jgi:hypothetical protein
MGSANKLSFHSAQLQHSIFYMHFYTSVPNSSIFQYAFVPKQYNHLYCLFWIAVCRFTAPNAIGFIRENAFLLSKVKDSVVWTMLNEGSECSTHVEHCAIKWEWSHFPQLTASWPGSKVACCRFRRWSRLGWLLIGYNWSLRNLR